MSINCREKKQGCTSPEIGDPEANEAVTYHLSISASLGTNARGQHSHTGNHSDSPQLAGDPFTSGAWPEASQWPDDVAFAAVRSDRNGEGSQQFVLILGFQRAPASAAGSSSCFAPSCLSCLVPASWLLNVSAGDWASVINAFPPALHCVRRVGAVDVPLFLHHAALRASVSVCVCVSICVYHPLSVCLPACLPVSRSVGQPVSQSVCLCVSLFVCLSASVSLCFCFCVFFYIFVFVSACLPL